MKMAFIQAEGVEAETIEDAETEMETLLGGVRPGC
jgi:hypothetical protein